MNFFKNKTFMFLASVFAVVSISLVSPNVAQAGEAGWVSNPNISWITASSNGSTVSQSSSSTSYTFASDTTRVNFSLSNPSGAGQIFQVVYFQKSSMDLTVATKGPAQGDSTSCDPDVANGGGGCMGKFDGSGNATFSFAVSGISSSSSFMYQINGTTASVSAAATVRFNGTITGPAPTGTPTPTGSPSPTATPSRVPATPVYLTFGAGDTRGNAAGTGAFEGATTSVGASAGGHADRALKVTKKGQPWSGVNMLLKETTMRISGSSEIAFDFYSPDSGNTSVLVKLDGAGFAQKVATAVPGWSRISIDMSTANGYSASANYPTLALFPNFDGTNGVVANQEYYFDNVSVNGGVLADGALDDGSDPLPSPTASPTSTGTASPTPTPTQTGPATWVSNPNIAWLTATSNGSAVTEQSSSSTYTFANDSTRINFSLHNPAGAGQIYQVVYFDKAGIDISVATKGPVQGDSTSCDPDVANGNGGCMGKFDGSGNATFSFNVSGVSSSSLFKFQINGTTASVSSFATMRFNGTKSGASPTPTPTETSTPTPTPTPTPTEVAKPVLAKAAAVVGTAKVGKTMTAARGTWSGATTYSYKWLACSAKGSAKTAKPVGCLYIAGGTKSTFKATAKQKNKYLRVEVTARKASAFSISVSAASTKIS